MGGRADPAVSEVSSGKPARRPLCFFIVIAVAVGIAGFVIGILIGRFAVCDQSDEDSPPESPQSGLFNRITQDADPDVRELLINDVSNVHIENNLR